MTLDLPRLLRTHLEDPECGFSIGGFGAIAEFQDDAAELVECDGCMLTCSSARGALRVELSGRESLLAYELRTEHKNGWQYGVAVIGADDVLSGRTVLTELEADTGAVHAGDRAAVLFDIGAGMPHIDYCVRTNNRDLIATLRRYAGTVVIERGHPVMDAIIDVSPHRVVISRIARIEVYQRIDRHQTPVGPHTHLLPDLLARRRTHSANIPIPQGWLPLLTLHPENPLVDAKGRQRAFVAAAYARFEALLESYGDATYVAEKQRFRAAIHRGQTPEDYVPAASRIGRLAQRIAMRQLSHCHTAVERHCLERWRTRFG